MPSTTILWVIIKSVIIASAICYITYGIIWLIVYYLHDLPINRFNNRLHKQTYIIKERTNKTMTQDNFYKYLMGDTQPANTGTNATPNEPKDTYTRAEVDRIIEEKTREILESIKPPTTPDKPSITPDKPAINDDTDTGESENDA